MTDAGEKYARLIESARRVAGQKPAEAERLLVEAIAIGERNLGVDHPALGAALNELSRLHIRQSDPSRAEPVLKRLLNIARTKGDSHPDVATALAGLAVAKRGLGENVAAEVLYRHALRIREDVLAPDHMAIVVTLEQLSETCATRGNLVEALVHLKRALPKREGALGADHASVHGLRARISDLERRIARSSPRSADRPTTRPTAAIEVPAAPGAPSILDGTAKPASSPAAPPVTPLPAPPARLRSPASVAALPRRSSDLVFLYEPDPVAARPAPARRERVPTPVRSVAATSAPSATRPTSSADEPPVRTLSVGLARMAPSVPGVAFTQLTAGAVAPTAVIADAPVIATTSRDVSDLFSSLKRATRYASAGTAVVVLAIVGSDFGPSDPKESERTSGATGAESRTALVTPASAGKSESAIGTSAADRTPAVSNAAARPSATQPAPASDAPAAAPSALVAVPSLRQLVVPKVAMPSLDSLMRGPERSDRDADPESSAATGGLLAPARNVDATVTPPVLVFAPTLRFPDELRAKPIDGEVVVQFRVNDKGRVDASSMQVLRSEHALFTAAVRNVLPRFRFQPARSAAPGSKPQSAWVQFRAEFTARH